jgi:hypothetical protein
MKLFLHNADRLVSASGNSVEQTLSRIGVHVIASQHGSALDPSSFDAVLMRASPEDSQSTYLIALALAKQKPVIYLYSKGQKIDGSIDQLRQDDSFKRLLRLVEFTTATLDRDVAKAIAAVEDHAMVEQPSIKFTLRITPSMERYLQWKSKKTGLSKADFLRQVVHEKIISQDQEYRDS